MGDQPKETDDLLLIARNGIAKLNGIGLSGIGLLVERLINRTEIQAAKLTELRAQMLSDQGQQMGDWVTPLLRWDRGNLYLGPISTDSCVTCARSSGETAWFGHALSFFQYTNDGNPHATEDEACAAVEKAVLEALGQPKVVKESLTTAPAETPRMCETCAHRFRTTIEHPGIM